MRTHKVSIRAVYEKWPMCGHCHGKQINKCFGDEALACPPTAPHPIPTPTPPLPSLTSALSPLKATKCQREHSDWFTKQCVKTITRIQTRGCYYLVSSPPPPPPPPPPAPPLPCNQYLSLTGHFRFLTRLLVLEQ